MSGYYCAAYSIANQKLPAFDVGANHRALLLGSAARRKNYNDCNTTTEERQRESICWYVIVTCEHWSIQISHINTLTCETFVGEAGTAAEIITLLQGLAAMESTTGDFLRDLCSHFGFLDTITELEDRLYVIYLSIYKVYTKYTFIWTVITNCFCLFVCVLVIYIYISVTNHSMSGL